MNTGRQEETEEGDGNSPRSVVFGLHFSPRLPRVCPCAAKVNAAKRSLPGKKNGQGGNKKMVLG